MIFAKLLKLRDKVTNKRKQLDMDEEKPFMEHLEDLRKMLMKITITLVLSMMISMIWYEDFMKIVQWPAHEAGLSIVDDKAKPEGYDSDRWEHVKEAARTALLLNHDQREAFYAQLAPQDPKLKAEAEALLIYKASSVFAKTLDKLGTPREPTEQEIADRDAFIVKAAGADKALLAAAQEMAKLKTRPDIEPAKPAIELVWRKPAESFFTAMKLALYAGFLVAFPLVFYFLLEFVLPGLTAREKKLLWPALAVGFGLFLTGMLFAFFWVVPRTLAFFHDFSGGIEGTKDLWTFADYTSFVTVFSLVFGASFELPVVVLVLVKLGLLSTEFMRRTRSWAIVIIVVVAAVITPTGDPGTLAALAVPMVVMYEACIWIALWMEKKAKAREEAEEREAALRHAELALTLPAAAAAGEVVSETPSEPSGPPQPVLHPEIQPYRNPYEDAYHDHEYHDHDHHNHEYHDHHQTEQDHDAWLKEQQEIYRKEHAHLFGDPEDAAVDGVVETDGVAAEATAEPHPISDVPETLTDEVSPEEFKPEDHDTTVAEPVPDVLSQAEDALSAPAETEPVAVEGTTATPPADAAEAPKVSPAEAKPPVSGIQQEFDLMLPPDDKPAN